jgi:hypothetical protein
MGELPQAELPQVSHPVHLFACSPKSVLTMNMMKNSTPTAATLIAVTTG